ncbi:unnamed protein product [Prorocentrum cordatum]|uniref:Pyruvate kinase n=1 Tax=Prorocentrum cordatum TaxID=2364126 RepID=A0ABN9YI95_9DINO|nr:unnamed protein product [Polarella glacialis]|mmetsp:Transcript_69323/g.187378  ORF Transcript_69323/g.187378 Transcript_69323/m.187378 type:complete len:449 (+) Transcript_69323:62-1408(+)
MALCDSASCFVSAPAAPALRASAPALRASAYEPRAESAASSGATTAACSFVAAGVVGAATSRRRRQRGERGARRAAETFQQLAMGYPGSYEEIADTNPVEKKTDIICTIGPKSWSPEKLVELMKAGMNVIRCNMSHGDHEEQSMKLANLEKAYELAPEFKGTVKILMDTRGPEIRTGTFEVYNSKKELKAGQDFKLVCNDYSMKGDESAVAITYSELPGSVKPGQRILIMDGTVVLEVKEPGDGFVMCKVMNDCKLGEKKNVNVPGVKVNLPVVDEREIKDIVDWAVPNNADYIALSFVQSPDDVKECRKHCADKPIKIISKIENVEGLKNFDAILAESDGIMVARGDLGMEIPMEKIFMAQKMMIAKTKAAGKYVVTATEMLASMEDKPFPTRAEACDVANAVLDGTSAVMLSSESAMGDFPVETVTMMRRICEEAEYSMTRIPVAA